MEKRNRHRLQTGLPQDCSNLTAASFIKWKQNRSGVVKTFLHLKNPFWRYRTRRFHPRIEIGFTGDIVPPDLQNVFETIRRHHGSSRSLTFKDRVGCDGRPVKDMTQFASIQLGKLQDPAHPLEKAGRRISKSRRRLRHPQHASLSINEDDVSECSTNIDTKSVA
jgi:hypothetical protein